MQEVIYSERKRKSVSIMGNTREGPFWARVFVNCTGPRATDMGSATLVDGRFRTLKGARRWAEKQLAE